MKKNYLLFLCLVHKKPLREVEIAAICHDALQVSIQRFRLLMTVSN